MNINNLEIGMIIKNYKELCKLIDEPIKSGDSKRIQMEKLSKLIDFHKEGNKIIIDDIKKLTPEESKVSSKKIDFKLLDDEIEYGNIIDKNRLMSLKVGIKFKSISELIKYLGVKHNRNNKQNAIKYIEEYVEFKSTNNKKRKMEIEIIKVNYNKPIHKKPRKESKKYKSKYGDLYLKNECSEYKGFYVYAHYINEEVVYIGKGCRRRATSGSGRKYNIEDLTDIKILKRFGDDELSALIYEEQMIEYYKSIGQCKYNDNLYHEGNNKNETTKINTEYKKIVKEKEKLKKERAKVINKLDELDNQIDKLDMQIIELEKLTKK